ncbi:oxalate decarboxylase [Enterococcus ureilyticus]|uniref:Oxalate decarboxylase n=1 Tax=Enterococcus ureilyticus TaxID=1131292 RepID=A0A1E5HDL3_9ENTE|nr:MULTISPECIES: oxalate decarboxylase family bicupin [Enterococcus]MBM7689922.1 oxalate decarboxylase [Enterococcus ureilyticus]MBO0421660.1 oxalate decarboxylase family bicupin [Enterococcus plantarum]MBO0446300.1 oxalate decarboxylase family bicupin [Enterococcus ureilyticus]MBO0468112.1 oxalate decarboxylase family bicupin [Enterococcus plantarum]OEG10118.1 oxalate decarboxylase [Enterococcus plantarum]
MSEEKKLEPYRHTDGKGWIDHGPRNTSRDEENPDILVPPATDHGTMANLRFSYSDSHQRLEEGGWTREITNRDFPISQDVAGVDMSLEPGAYREMHWHKEAEWGLMLYGNARVTGIDEYGRSFIDDIKAGDLWNFEAGVPHSIQALDEGCEFLLVFSEADFSENNTFLLSDWLAHTPPEVVAANFKKSTEEIESFPAKEKYIFKANIPGSIEEVERPNVNGKVPSPFTFHMDTIKPIESEAGRVRIVDQNVFPVAKTISAAFVEVEPGGMRELHWHPKAAEWQYYIQGKARMTVFNSAGVSRTFDFQAGDVGVVPIVAGHYVQNIGDEPLIFVEVFKHGEYSDISLNKWLGSSPSQMVADHLNVTKQFAESLPNPEKPQPVVWFKKPE